MGAFADTFAPLRNRNLATYLGGQAVSLIGTAVQSTALSWVVWDLSRSARDLGLVTMLGTLPLLLLGMLGGLMADRLDRRKLLIGTQLAAMAAAVAFAVLVQGHWIQLWQIYLLSFLMGCVTAVDMPAQGAFVSDLSGLQQVRQATVLNSMIVMTSRLIGSAAAGLTIAAFGVAMAFWLNGASFLVVIGSLLMVRAQQMRKPAQAKGGGEMAEGLRFIGTQPRIQDLLLFALTVTFFGMGASQLLPAIVTDTLHQGAGALGMLMGAGAGGALVSTLFIVPVAQKFRRVGWVVAGAAVWSGICMMAFATSPWAWLSTLLMFMVSLGTPVVATTAMGLLQVLAPEQLRARLLAIWMMVMFGTQPVAGVALGYLANSVGVPTAIIVSGAAMLVIPLLLLVLRPDLRRWEMGPMGHGQGQQRPRPQGAHAASASAPAR